MMTRTRDDIHPHLSPTCALVHLKCMLYVLDNRIILMKPDKIDFHGSLAWKLSLL